jgi:hypothetical protein
MRQSTIPIVLLLLACVVAIGAYRGWFSLSSGSSDAGRNKVNINLTVDQEKMQQDAAMVKEQAALLSRKVTEPVNESQPQTRVNP